MAEIMLPSQLNSASSHFRYIDSTGLVRGAYTGAAETTAYGGDRIGASIDFTPVGGQGSSGQADRGVLLAWLATLKGRQNRAWLWDHAYKQRGSFPSGELITNNIFSNGTTGWLSSSEYTLSLAGRTLRATRNAVTVAQTVGASVAFNITQYAAYAMRAMVIQGRGTFSQLVLYDSISGGSGFTTPSGAGYLTIGIVPNATTAQPGVVDFATSGVNPGDYFEIPFVSYARCALVDNGRSSTPFSDQLDNAAITKTNATVIANAAAACDGTSTADSITETSATGQHLISLGSLTMSGAKDYFVGGEFKQGAKRSRVSIGISDGTNAGQVIFDLTNGTIVQAINSGTATGARGAVVNLGNGCYYCGVVMRPGTAGAGSYFGFASTASGTSTSFAGDNTGVAIYARRFMVSQASAADNLGGTFQRLVQTTAAAVPAGTLQTGSALFLKGLPASSNGLLLPGDWVQVGRQIVMVTSALNSDAAGLGYLQFSPPLRVSPADNDPVIINQPMGKFIFAGQFPEWMNVPGVITTASLDFEESCD